MLWRISVLERLSGAKLVKESSRLYNDQGGNISDKGGMLHLLYERWTRYTEYAVRGCYNAVKFLKNPHERHPIARPLGQDIPYPEPVYTGWSSVHWNATGWLSVHWDTTGRPSEYFQGTLEHYWKKLNWNSPTLECQFVMTRWRDTTKEVDRSLYIQPLLGVYCSAMGASSALNTSLYFNITLCMPLIWTPL